jgi:hypothetical protein
LSTTKHQFFDLRILPDKSSCNGGYLRFIEFFVPDVSIWSVWESACESKFLKATLAKLTTSATDDEFRWTYYERARKTRDIISPFHENTEIQPTTRIKIQCLQSLAGFHILYSDCRSFSVVSVQITY